MQTFQMRAGSCLRRNWHRVHRPGEVCGVLGTPVGGAFPKLGLRSGANPSVATWVRLGFFLKRHACAAC